jgi:hypothetical protein
MRRFSWMALAALAGVTGLLLGSATTTAADPARVLDFDTMAAVTGPYVGTANPIRDVPGGGLPWMIQSGMGQLSTDGRLFIRVRGLVLADQAPVPASLRGTNPIPDFKGLVSCQTIGPDGAATITNVSTAPFPASKEGDSLIFARLSLPHPCIAPIVFVTSPSGAWFAATGGS